MIPLIVAGLGGAAFGALVSLIANIFVLPMVLRQQGTFGPGSDIPGMAGPKAVKLIYRYLMPPCFIGVFATVSVIQFGGVA